jgi:hypothetical protein
MVNLNRRSFLKNSALALFGFSVLPPAKTYERIWKAQRKLTTRITVNPAWRDAPYELIVMGNLDAGYRSEIQIKGGYNIVDWPLRYMMNEQRQYVEVQPFVLDTSEIKA